MVKELDWKHFNILQMFETRNTNVVALSDVQKYTVDKEQEGLNVKMLAPRET